MKRQTCKNVNVKMTILKHDKRRNAGRTMTILRKKMWRKGKRDLKPNSIYIWLAITRRHRITSVANSGFTESDGHVT